MSDPRPPKLPDRYEIIRLLGRGGMGAVYLAKDRPLDRLVAVKVLLDGAAARTESLSRFAREAKAMAAFEHPNLIRIFDVDLAGPVPHLAMEYISGLTLDRIIERQAPLPADLVLRWGRELAGALAVMHRAGVNHRDLKPSNVMIRKAGEAAVLMDLGLVRAEQGTQLTGTGRVIGTPAYMPPEALEGSGAWTPGSDQFQLGAILFEALTKRRRVPGDSLEALAAALMAGRLEDWPADLPLSRDLKEVVGKAGSPDPAARYPSVESLATALGSCVMPGDLTGSFLAFPEPSRAFSLPAVPAAPTPAPAPAGSGRRLAWIAAGLAVAALVAGLVARTPAPAEVRIEAVGDAVLAVGKTAGARGLALELGDRRFPATVEGSDGTFRAVAPGLDPDQPTRVRLVWQGGAGEEAYLTAGPPAIGTEVKPGAGRSVRLEVQRPTKVRWGGEPEGGAGLEPGLRALPAPPAPLPEETRLTWLDQDVPQARPVRWAEVLAKEFERLVDAADPEDVARRTRQGPGLEPERALWASAIAWIPDLMRSRAPDDLKLRAFASWEALERSLSAERFEGAVPASLPAVDGVLGLRFLGPVDSKSAVAGGPVVSRTLALTPVGGYDHTADPRGLELATLGSARMPNPRYGRAAQALKFRWPEEAPRKGAIVLVALDVARLSDAAQLRIRAVDPAAGGPQVHLWNPSTSAEAANGSLIDWVGVGLPAELAWAPGTELAIEMLPLAQVTYSLGWVRCAVSGWVVQ